MKMTLSIFLLLCPGITALYGQNQEIKFVIDTSIQIMKANSANSEKVDWTSIRKQAFEQARDLQNIYQLGPVFKTIFKALNDFHGTAFIGDSAYKWTRDEPALSDSINNEWKKGVFLQTRILNGNIGYLRVPYMSNAERPELNKKAQHLNDSLCFILGKNVSGIVVDLRLNGGGAMFPMMLGLEHLLRDGTIGSFTGKSRQNWILKENNFYLDTSSLVSIVPICSIPAKLIPVVVLIGPGTGSSGEFLAMSFKKRKNTIFLGEKTAGYVTSVGGFKVNAPVYLYLSTGYGRDRTGQIYEQALAPDIYITEPDSFNDIEHDKKVLEAMKWINKNK